MTKRDYVSPFTDGWQTSQEAVDLERVDAADGGVSTPMAVKDIKRKIRDLRSAPGNPDDPQLQRALEIAKWETVVRLAEALA